MQLVINLATDEGTDPDDDGSRTAYIKLWGRQEVALKNAARELGCVRLSEVVKVGNRFTATYVRDEPSKRGFPTKIYEYHIEPGAQAAAQLDEVAPLQAPPAPAAPAVVVPAAPAMTLTPPTPAPAAPAAPAASPDQIRAYITAGYNDTQIGNQFGIDPSAVALIRASLT